MAEPEPETFELPFDPNTDPPEIDPDELSDEERAIAAAHGHYYHCRQLLDAMITSAYNARMAGADPDVLRAAEIQAITDHELELAEEDEDAALLEPEEAAIVDELADQP
jgi:hypothetical protein